MRGADCLTLGKSGRLRLHEKGGREHEVPCHHKFGEVVGVCFQAAGIEGQRHSPLWRSTCGRTKGMSLVEMFRM